MVYVVKCLIGILVFDEKQSLINYKLFSKNPEDIAKALSSFSSEEREVLENLKNLGYKEIITDLDIEYSGLEIKREKDNPAANIVREKLREFAQDLGFCSPAEINKLLNQVNINLTKEKIKRQKRDKVLMQVIGVIGEVDKVTNTLSERLVEWYGLHFPELQQRVNSNEKYASLVSQFGLKENIEDDKLKELITKSSGMEFNKDDEENLKTYAESIGSLFKLREGLAKYIEKLTKEVIPNTSEVAGPLLAAKLVQLAGGLEKLGRLPSSTIQLMGAEKALFRHLKGQGKSPKYGAIYQHSLIQQVDREKRGKAARMIAAKISLAAKIDSYSERDDGEKLRKELEEEIKKI